MTSTRGNISNFGGSHGPTLEPPQQAGLPTSGTTYLLLTKYEHLATPLEPVSFSDKNTRIEGKWLTLKSEHPNTYSPVSKNLSLSSSSRNMISSEEVIMKEGKHTGKGISQLSNNQGCNYGKLTFASNLSSKALKRHHHRSSGGPSNPEESNFRCKT